MPARSPKAGLRISRRAKSKKSCSAESMAKSERWTVAHDFIMAYGGAEWVTQVMCQETFPGSLLVYLAGLPHLADRMSPGEKRSLLPPVYNRATYRALLPTYPPVLKRLPVLPGNLIASSYAFVNG